MIMPKSKYSAKAEIASQYYIKNIIETLHIGETRVEINCFYDTIHKGNRFSCTINHKKGTAVCGGYGKDNEITHKTYESILNYILKNVNVSLDTIRDFKLKLLLDNE